jgi:hypothetical protein
MQRSIHKSSCSLHKHKEIPLCMVRKKYFKFYHNFYTSFAMFRVLGWIPLFLIWQYSGSLS